MAFGARARMVNPRLGTYFSIFAALFTALFLLILIFEQLRLDEHLLKLVFFAGPIVIYAAIGLSVASNDTLNYFASGRRVPALYTGVLLATCSLGGTFLVAGTGAFFFAGFDALVLMLGTLTGFVVMAIVLAPFYRKFGAFTVPSYLGRRFESRPLRIITAVVAAVPMLLVLSAELRMGAGVAGRLITASPNMIVALLALSVAVSTASGGMRSFTWVGVAQSIAVFLALLGVATTVSVIVTSLPIPQLANGPMVRSLVHNEVREGLQVVNVWPLAFQLPGEGFAALTKPYTQPFGTIGPLAFVLGTFAIATGISTAPWLLAEGGRDPERLRGAQSTRMGHRVFWPRDTDDFIRRCFHAGLCSRYGDERTARAIAEVALRCSDGPPRRVRSIGGAIGIRRTEVRSRWRALRAARGNGIADGVRVRAHRRHACRRSRHGKCDDRVACGCAVRGRRTGAVLGTGTCPKPGVDHAWLRDHRCCLRGLADDHGADRSSATRALGAVDNGRQLVSGHDPLDLVEAFDVRGRDHRCRHWDLPPRRWRSS